MVYMFCVLWEDFTLSSDFTRFLHLFTSILFETLKKNHNFIIFIKCIKEIVEEIVEPSEMKSRKQNMLSEKICLFIEICNVQIKDKVSNAFLLLSLYARCQVIIDMIKKICI